MSTKVRVPKDVVQQLETIRSEGRVNMFDFDAVQAIAREYGFYNAVAWMDDHMAEWERLVRHGFEIIDDVPRRRQ